MDRDILLPHSNNIEEVFFKKRVKMLISFLIPSILFEYGGKRNSHHIKNHGTTYIRIKEKEEEKEESVYNPFLYFMSFFKNSLFYKPVYHLIQHTD